MMAELAELSLPGFDAFPSEEELAAARRQAPVRLGDDGEEEDGGMDGVRGGKREWS